MLRVGIIGYGTIGSQHAKAFLENKIDGALVTAVCNRGDGSRQKALDDFNNQIQVFKDYRNLVNSGVCDAVIICTPHFSHVEIASFCLQKDIHVLLEKPVGSSVYNVKKLNEIAKNKKDVVFAMMFNQRKNPLYEKAKEIIDSGVIGEIRRVNWIDTWLYRPQAYFNRGEWRGTWDGEGGGVLLNQASHQLDLIQWLVGMPETVYSICKFGGYHDINVEDDVTTLFTYKNGATGVFITSTFEWPGTNRLEISGSKGRMVVETSLNSGNEKLPINQKIIVDEYEMDEGEFSRATARDENWREYDFKRKEIDLSLQLNDKNLARQNRIRIIIDFIESIKQNKKPCANGIEGINSLILSNAMMLSAWENNKIELGSFDFEKFDKLLVKKRSGQE